MLDDTLSAKLVDLYKHDERIRSELLLSGELFDGYHPRMAAVHTENAQALEEIIEAHGWPGFSLVGKEGADAAWHILQHAIGSPALQRRCLPLLIAAAKENASARSFAGTKTES